MGRPRSGAGHSLRDTLLSTRADIFSALGRKKEARESRDTATILNAAADKRSNFRLTAPFPERRVELEYPRNARDRDFEFTVAFYVLIRSDGTSQVLASPRAVSSNGSGVRAGKMSSQWTQGRRWK